jgi:hypothetical protein
MHSAKERSATLTFGMRDAVHMIVQVRAAVALHIADATCERQLLLRWLLHRRRV